MSSDRHILWITPGFPKDEEDSTCIPVLQSLAEGLKDQKGLKIRILSIHYPLEEREYKWQGIPVYACGAANRGFPMRFWSWRKILQKLRKWQQEQPFDQVHAFWLSEAAWLGQRFATQYQLPFSVTLMGQEFEGKNRYLKRLDKDKMELVSISPRMSRQCEKLFRKKPEHLIPWGLEPVSTDPEAERPIDVLGVGNLTALKNYSAWLETLALLKRAKPDFKAVLIGEGPQLALLNARAKSLGIEDQVQFVGKIAHDEVLRTMQEAKVLLHTSQYESFGAVLNEALASGMAVVSSPVGIAEDGPRMKTGTSPEEWSNAILRYWEAEALPPHPPHTLKTTLHGYRKLFMD